MPSKALRAALLVGIMIALSLTTFLMLGGFNILVGGAIPLMIVYFSMVVPSRGLVTDVTAIIGNNLGQTAPPWLQLSLWWPIAGIAVCTILLVGTLTVIKSRAPKPAAVFTPEKTTVEMPELPQPNFDIYGCPTSLSSEEISKACSFGDAVDPDSHRRRWGAKPCSENDQNCRMTQDSIAFRNCLQETFNCKL